MFQRSASAVLSGAFLCAAAGVCMTGTPARAHDEDKYKLRDLEPPFRGPKVLGPIAPNNQGQLGPFSARNVTLQAWLPLNWFPGSQGSGADCWGYVSSSGREYAIMGLEDGTAFVEITNPTNPVLTGYVAGSSTLWHDSAVIGDYAYLVSDSSGPGIQVVDMRNIDNGQLPVVTTFRGSGLSTSHTILANPASNYVYLCGTNINSGGLTAVDVSNPATPVIRGSWRTHYVHEAQIITYTTGPYAGREIAFCFTGGPYNGNYATGLDIVDVTNKANMFTVSSFRYPNIQFCHQGWLDADRRYLYVNDELDEAYTGVPMITRVIDVSDLSRPRLAATFTNNNTAIDHNEYVNGRWLYQSNYRSGLRVWDLSNPTAPTEHAFFDTYPNSDGVSFSGAWGNYPFFPSGNIVISDITRGMFVVRVQYPCDADFNADGTLDSDDFFDFLNAYNSGDIASDFNGDGTVDSDDFFDFLNAYNAGC